MRAISLIYHDVTERGEAEKSGFTGADAALYKLDCNQFDAHLNAIAAKTDAPILVSEIPASKFQKPPLLLTFDDGGVGAYTCTAEMLERAGWRGHFFVSTDYIGARGFLDRAQIQDLRARGHVIGTHSCSHPVRMSHCSWQELLDEWSRSVETLSGILGEQVTVASVPGGFYSRKIAEAASAAGLRTLFNSEPVTTVKHVDDCAVLGRYSIQRGTSADAVASLVAGRITPRVSRAFGWNVKKVGKKLGGQYYLKARKIILSGR